MDIELDNHKSPTCVEPQQDGQRHDNTNVQPAATQEFSLPPADSGKDAWFFLAACWVVEALVWGFGFSFGVFQDYYASYLPFKGSANIAVVGTSTLGVMYIATPFVITLCRLRPRLARWFTLGGLVVASLVMGLSSLCTTVTQLIATQGVLFGIAGCFAYSPCILYIDEWFVRRKGLAYGIMWSAAGFGGVVLPLLLEFLLENYGFQTALRVWAGILFVFSIPLSLFVKPRLPYSAATNLRPFNMRCVLSRRFLLHQFANVIQATGYFLPGVYLPSYARINFGTSTLLSAVTVLLVNIAATVGSIIMGSMTDKLPVTTCLIISSMGASLATLLLWGLTSSLAGLYAFCFMYGLFAGCYTSIWPGIMREIANPGESESQGHIDPTLVFGWLCAGRGIGNVVSGPLSGVLIHSLPWKGHAIGGFGSGYGSLIVYTGVSAVLGGSGFIMRHLGVLK
ncbi:major facilitator superfamily domain-containing protein [Cladorrhinum samala]|uniref:Major facilitator superfamily domain-containing protein n=1 Tax=Cladorrhinum samala TaxID=585594 RepID=A0AAV9HMI6_9PEZI|nr:major facilitator superfamily domain-containing protein [Cladorrhinum samala]